MTPKCINFSKSFKLGRGYQKIDELELNKTNYRLFLTYIDKQVNYKSILY